MAKDKRLLHTACQWAKENSILASCKRTLGSEIDYLFVNHWFRRGGAELETLLLIRALQKLRPRLRIGLVTTLNTPSEWEHLIPNEIKRVHFGKLTAGIPKRVKNELLFRLLAEQSPKVIHNVISDTCWDVFVSSSTSLAKRSLLLASSFCANYPRNKPEAFALSHLPRCKGRIAAVLVDNRKHAREVRAKKKGVRVHALRFPVHNAFVPPKKKKRDAKRASLKTGRGLNLLWAGRMDYQKRIDVLYLVALFNPRHSFHVWGEFVADRPNSYFNLAKLQSLENVRIHEKYDRIEQIPLKKFDAFLYTSAWDGMPNVLIEMATKGLPIIAPDVGGVGEFITAKTGYLISNPNAIGEYTSALDRIEKDPEGARMRALEAQRFLRTKHSRRQFEAQLGEILDGVGI